MTEGDADPGFDPPWAQRGTDTGRLLSLSDGIFAFAMTLLVLGLALPAQNASTQLSSGQLGYILNNLRDALLAFVLSFFVIWFYWVAHHQIFSYIVSFDRPLQQLNVLFLLFIVMMPFLTDVIAASHDSFLAVAIYALGQIGAGGTLTALWLYASRTGGHVTRKMPASWVDYVLIRTAMTPLVFGVSIPIAWFSPSLAEYFWATVFVVQIVFRRKRAHDVAAAPPSATSGALPPG